MDFFMVKYTYQQVAINLQMKEVYKHGKYYSIR